MDADRGEQVGVGGGHDRRLRAAGRQAGDVDAGRVDRGARAMISRAMPAISEGSPRSRAWSPGWNQFQQRWALARALCSG